MYERLFREFLFPSYESLVKRRATGSHLKALERDQFLPRERIEAIQLHALNRLLEHCWREVPFLRGYWSDHGLRPGPLAAVGELERYPLLDKQLITRHYADMIAESWRGRTLSKTTGGSTGDPFRFEYTSESYARRTAVMWRAYRWGGAGLGARTAYLWGSRQNASGWPATKDRLYHAAFNRRFFDAFALDDRSIDAVIEGIRAYRPDALVGYVAPVALLARRMLETGRRMTGLRGVLTGAEALLDPERDAIEQAFGCRAFNTYGSREFMLMASECEHHDGLHVNADQLVLETVDESGVAVSGTSGRVVVTDLWNYGMPFVRYLNGDAATRTHRSCPCGRGLPLLSSVDGRLLDAIRTPDGRTLLGEYFVYLMLDVRGVLQWQAVQTAEDAVEFRIVARETLDEQDLQRLVASAQQRAGPTMRVRAVQVPAIATTPSGKRRLTLSLARARSEGLA